MNPAEFANIAAAEQKLWWYRGMWQILVRLLDPVTRDTKIERVIEAGCGTGYMSRMLGERYGWTMFPMDLGEEGLEYARSQGIARLMRGDITKIPCKAGTFDALVSLDVIPHLERGREQGAFDEFARVVRPGGLLVLRAAALDILRSRHSEFVHERQRFTRAQLVRSAEAAGFRIEFATYANSFLVPVSLFKFRVWEPLMRQAPASGVQAVPEWLDRLLYIPLSIEAAWIGRKWTLPVGQTVILVGRRK